MKIALVLATLVFLGACALTAGTKADIEAIQAEQAAFQTQIDGSAARLADIVAGAEADPGESVSLELRIGQLEGEIRGRDDLIARMKAKDYGEQSGMLQNIMIAVAGMFGLGGVAQAKFGKSRSQAAVGDLQVEVARLTTLIGAFGVGMANPPATTHMQPPITIVPQ